MHQHIIPGTIVSYLGPGFSDASMELHDDKIMLGNIYGLHLTFAFRLRSSTEGL